MNANINQIAILVLSVVVVIGFGSVLIAWMIWPPEANSNVLSALIGALGAGYLQVINYWFRGSGGEPKP